MIGEGRSVQQCGKIGCEATADALLMAPKVLVRKLEIFERTCNRAERSRASMDKCNGVAGAAGQTISRAFRTCNAVLL